MGDKYRASQKSDNRSFTDLIHSCRSLATDIPHTPANIPDVLAKDSGGIKSGRHKDKRLESKPVDAITDIPPQMKRGPESANDNRILNSKLGLDGIIEKGTEHEGSALGAKDSAEGWNTPQQDCQDGAYRQQQHTYTRREMCTGGNLITSSRPCLLEQMDRSQESDPYDRAERAVVTTNINKRNIRAPTKVLDEVPDTAEDEVIRREIDRGEHHSIAKDRSKIYPGNLAIIYPFLYLDISQTIHEFLSQPSTKAASFVLVQTVSCLNTILSNRPVSITTLPLSASNNYLEITISDPLPLMLPRSHPFHIHQLECLFNPSTNIFGSRQAFVVNQLFGFDSGCEDPFKTFPNRPYPIRAPPPNRERYFQTSATRDRAH